MDVQLGGGGGGGRPLVGPVAFLCQVPGECELPVTGQGSERQRGTANQTASVGQAAPLLLAEVAARRTLVRSRSFRDAGCDALGAASYTPEAWATAGRRMTGTEKPLRHGRTTYHQFLEDAALLVLAAIGSIPAGPMSHLQELRQDHAARNSQHRPHAREGKKMACKEVRYLREHLSLHDHRKEAGPRPGFHQEEPLLVKFQARVGLRDAGRAPAQVQTTSLPTVGPGSVTMGKGSWLRSPAQQQHKNAKKLVHKVGRILLQQSLYSNPPTQGPCAFRFTRQNPSWPSLLAFQERGKGSKGSKTRALPEGRPWRRFASGLSGANKSAGSISASRNGVTTRSRSKSMLTWSVAREPCEARDEGGKEAGQN